MGSVYLAFLFFGLLLILNFYRKRINASNRIIEIGTIPNSNFPKLPLVRQAEYEKFNYQVVGFLSLVCYLLAGLNLQYDFVRAWIVLCIFGISIAISSYQLNTSPLNLNLEEPTEEDNLRLKLRKQEAKNISLIILALSVVVSGNWAYQFQKNESLTRTQAMQEISAIAGNGWCSNFSDINVYDGGSDVVKSGGWPCINVGDVSNEYFSKEGKSNKLCITASLNKENGAPGEERFLLSYKDVDVCVVDTYSEGWSTDEFLRRIYESIGSDLDSLQVSLCRTYAFRMGELTRASYC